MSAIGSKSRTKLLCQFQKTYLPPSYLPQYCQETETYPQFAWALINTVFVGTTTIVNTTIFLAVVFLWLVNRQFHFKKHSYDKKPLQPLKKPSKALKKAGKKLKSAAKTISFRKKKRGLDETQAEEVALVDGDETLSPLAKQSNYKSFQSFLASFDEGDEDDVAIEKSLSSSDILKRSNSGGNLLAAVPENIATEPEIQAKKKRTKDLLSVASKIEVFSYLSPAAVKDILEYVEYVDLKNVGDVVYDSSETLDGSMFAVIEGEVTTSLSIDKRPGNMSPSSSSTDSNQKFSFVAGPGQVITSMLSLITSLVREYQLQDSLLHSMFPGVLGGGTSSGVGGSSKIVIPQGMNVKALVTSPNTRLLRIPSQCFVAIMEKYPADVHSICQTIVARLQRVTIQTLVRFLGLEAGILGMSDMEMAMSKGGVPEKKPRKTTQEWNEFEQSLIKDSHVVDQTTLAATALHQATQAAASLLGLSAENCHQLKEGTSIVNVPPGGIICRKGEPPDAIYLILKGSLEVGLERNSVQNDNGTMTSYDQNGGDSPKKAKRSKSDSSDIMHQDQSKPFKALYTSAPGNWVGLFSSFTHDASFITVRNPDANSSAMVLKIPTNTFENVISSHPRALVHCLLDIIDTVGDGANLCVSPSMFLLDMGLDWMHVEAGEAIAIRGELCDSMYVVLNGRLRVEASKEESKSSPKYEEYSRGGTVGEVEALAGGNWSQSVYAIRHSEVARIPIRIVNILMEIFPSAGIHFARVIASQVHSRKGLTGPMNSISSLLPSYSLSLATIAVVSLTEEVDTADFCSVLEKSLASIAPTKLLTKKYVKECVGSDFFKHRNAMLKVKMTRILGDFEESNRLVVYQSDFGYTWWTKLCIQQADCVLILVDSKNAPELKCNKRVGECLAWANDAKKVRCELVVVQSLSAQEEVLSISENASDELNDWSEERPWISKQHLIRCPFQDHTQDFLRMSRRVTGQSVGLVLGGGGARGLAHLGVIKALNEVGITVDMVGGTSQGAFVGALLARDPDDYEKLLESVGEMASDLSSISNKLKDLTFPLTSFFSGHYFNKGIQKVLGNVRIQDFVLNFFCVSVDISNSCQMVHTKGLAWKYVRASMSLTGYLPPISEDNRLLVDGGYMNMVPADVMAEEMGAKYIIAVDVSAEKSREYYSYGTELSGLWLLWNSWNPFVQTVKVPSMGDLAERLSWVSAERTKNDMVKNKADLFLRPPVNEFGTLEFDKIDEIAEIGYRYAKPLVEEWAEENGW